MNDFMIVVINNFHIKCTVRSAQLTGATVGDFSSMKNFLSHGIFHCVLVGGFESSKSCRCAHDKTRESTS